ncbi:class I SAM-dependent methyltransferase [Acuticoccus sp. M5D2P5]|uniref:SAM-dependent methyltransferase n=1 Tax=Acuticoccus kalidii TaxID=2910977 RepID=UPI001F2D8D2C|nr:class I SAM-dependent methyltransferase [Acuticoccus kalidii]MCF3934154.1 class I SAM-dependent methyltransferase [Acuticoccus kalidii]
MAGIDKASVIKAINERIGGTAVPQFVVTFPGGGEERFGDPASNAAAFQIDIKTETGAEALASLDEYRLALAYLDGDIDLDGDFLKLLDMRLYLSDRHPWLQFLRFALPMVRGQVKNDNDLVPRHYNHGNAFYFAFLDRSHRLYSQALYADDDEDLETAARRKLETIWDVCGLRPGSRVLDIGAGWGSFSDFAAARGAEVTMLTISSEQLAYLKSLAETRAHGARMTPILRNVYEFETDEPFDAIVLLGVMEHLPHYRRFLRHAGRIVRDQGRIYMDFAANRRKYASSTFSHQHVFEGNHSLVHMPGLVSAVNKTDFEIVTIDNDRHSYFLTLCQWARNLEEATPALIERFGLKTLRLFRLYLWGTAQCMQSGKIESYRVVVQKAARGKSSFLGLRT